MNQIPKIFLASICLIMFFSFSKSKDIIIANGQYKGIVIGKSNLTDVENTFGSKYSKSEKTLSVHFIDGENENVLYTSITYKSKGVSFIFIGEEIKNETVGQIVFMKPNKSVTDKEIMIGKSKVKDVISKYDDGFWNCGVFFSRKLTISYDGIDFIFNKQISSDELKTINKKELNNLKVFQIRLKKIE